MNTITVKGQTFEVQCVGAIVRVIATEAQEIVESAFPSKYYRSPSQFVGRVIGFYVAD